MNTTTEIAIPEGVLIDPTTGEATELAKLDNSEIKEGLRYIETLSAAVAEAKRKLAEEAMRRKNAGDPIIGVEVSRRNSWRPGETGAALDKLEREGLLPTGRETYLKPETSFKAVGKNLNDLLASLIENGHTEAAEVLLTGRKQSVSAKVMA